MFSAWAFGESSAFVRLLRAGSGFDDNSAIDAVHQIDSRSILLGKAAKTKVLEHKDELETRVHSVGAAKRAELHNEQPRHFRRKTPPR